MCCSITRMRRRGSLVGEGKDSYGRHKNAADLPIDLLMSRLRALGSSPGDS